MYLFLNCQIENKIKNSSSADIIPKLINWVFFWLDLFPGMLSLCVWDVLGPVFTPDLSFSPSSASWPRKLTSPSMTSSHQVRDVMNHFLRIIVLSSRKFALNIMRGKQQKVFTTVINNNNKHC